MALVSGTFCIPRKAWFLGLTILSVILMFWLTTIKSSVRLVRDEILEESIAAMQTRLKFLEAQYSGKQEEIIKIQEKFDRHDLSQEVTGADVTYTMLSPAVEELLRNISGSKAADAAMGERAEVIKAPFSLRIMPHLMNNPDKLRPAYHLKSDRKLVDYIIGIPHVKRDKETYLYVTIKFLLKSLTIEDRNKLMIVVMVGETDLEYVIETAYNIEQEFSDDLKSGLIEVISPSKYYYPDFDSLPATLGDSPKRTRWRTKQNLDAIFLMAYSESKCVYYLMIEDDVIATDGYMTDIRKFTASTTVSNPNWFFIQYSTTGGIGKLFRSTDLIHFMTYVQLFYGNMPIDWLTESYLADRSCGINKGAKECADAKTKIRPTYRKNLFKHVGLYSSLKGKLIKVKGSVSDTAPTFFPHKNPPLSKIKCDLGHHKTYTIESAYLGQSFFWGTHPNKGDVIEFWFEKPTTIGWYMIRSGNLDHASDKIHHAALEVMSNTTGENFVKIAEFDEFGLVEGPLEGSKFGNLTAMRIKFEEPSKFWVVIAEIELVPLKKEIETINQPK